MHSDDEQGLAAGASALSPSNRSRTTSVGSLARLISETTSAALMTLTGVMTARSLGASGKGTLAALLFLIIFVSHAISLGLGDVAVVLIASGRMETRLFAGAAVTILAMSLLVGYGLLLALSAIGLGGSWHAVAPTIPIAWLAVVGWALVLTFSGIANAHHWLVLTAVAQVIVWLVTFAVTFVIVIAHPLSLRTALAATAAGTLAGATAIIAVVSARGIVPLPRWDVAAMHTLIRTGAPVGGGYLLTVLSLRVDVLIVFWLVNGAAAGTYSVALTIAQLVSYAPLALATGTFPSLAGLAPTEADVYARRLQRLSALAALVLAIPLGFSLPLLVPLVFGEGFAPAVLPALILLGGAVAWSVHWSANRTLAVRADHRALLGSHAAALAAMVCADLLLVGPFGSTGAAVGSVAGSLTGATIAWRKAGQQGPHLRDLVPTPDDIKFTVSAIRRALAR